MRVCTLKTFKWGDGAERRRKWPPPNEAFPIKFLSPAIIAAQTLESLNFKMGKGSVTKKKSSEAQIAAMATFFTPQGQGGGAARLSPESQKMADAQAGKVMGPFEGVTKEDLRAELAAGHTRMETTLLEKLTALIAPQNAQIQSLQESVTQLTQTAENAMELGLANQDSTRRMQRHSEWATEKILFLENQLRMENLKFRGFPEGAEESKDLKGFISTWLATIMNLEEGISPQLIRAYRLGSSRWAPNSLPRDILVKCYDLRTKQKIMEVARKRGHLLYHNHKIMVLQDLSAETLEARKKLRPLTSALSKANIRYRWQAYTRVQIVYKGSALIAEDFGSAAKMLQHLKLEVPEELKDPDDPGDADPWEKAGVETRGRITSTQQMDGFETD